MEYARYGDTALTVSRLCIGTGHFKGAYPDPEAGGQFLEQVLEHGVTFWDTAESYGSHPHVAAAFRRVDRSRVVLQTKTVKAGYEAARKRIDAALTDLGTDYLDVILLHGVTSPKVRVVGCSTHLYTGPVMDAVTARPEIEVILATVNKGGIMLEGSIMDLDPAGRREPPVASMEDHIRQVRRAYEAGKGISIMKIIGQRSAPEAEWDEWIRWGFEFPYAHAVNLGITFPKELELDLQIEDEETASRLQQAA
ncbi:MAG: aldo/keto reductase [Armatimonadetes bacterium]|nr:aldo/keto reductase [Armatimonadota bacterium]